MDYGASAISNGAYLWVSVQTIDHPRAPQARGIVRMDVFWSMWRSRTIPCPHGSGRPACETVLLHHEQFKIPENLARFAVRHGMTGFVKKMGPAVEQFVADRRTRVSLVRTLFLDPLFFMCTSSFPLSERLLSLVLATGQLTCYSFLCILENPSWLQIPVMQVAFLMGFVMHMQFEDDPEAYGVTGVPNPPSRSPSLSSASSMSDLSLDSVSEAGSETLAAAPAVLRAHRQGADRKGENRRRGPVRRLQQINAALIAAGVAFTLGRSTRVGGRTL